MANIFNISSSVQFLDELALGLIDRFDDLQDVTVFLPTKRAIVGLQKAFARHIKSGTGFLPKIEALGDVDEDEFILHGFPHIKRLPTAISQNSRLLKITRMIMLEGGNENLNAAQALQIAFQLCQLLDEFHNRKADLSALKDVVPNDFSEHWEKTLKFLDVITTKWQAYKQENSILDEVERRNLLLNEVANYWQEFPPEKPIVIAGTTATIPATQQLITSLCKAKNGYLVLYGLDENLREFYDELEPTHPQYNLSQLLVILGDVEVAAWGNDLKTSRQQLLQTALLPKTQVQQWQKFTAAQEDLQLLQCLNSEEEASIVAMILRESLENASQKAALVTNNKNFAKRVESKLLAWNIHANNSHSSNLESTDLGQLILLIADFLISRQQPAKTLALFKHKFIAEAFYEQIIAIENKELRGLRQEDFCVSEHLSLKSFAPLKELFVAEDCDFHQLFTAILSFAEELSAADVWQKSEPQEVEQLHNILREIKGFGLIDKNILYDLLSQLLSLQSSGFKPLADSKIEILSPIESRFTDADLVIISGLNEGDFTSAVGGSDLLNQQMRRQLGLDLPDRRIGQQAHDFELLSQAPRVVYTRAKKDAGAPTVASRFIQSLTSLIDLDTGEKYQAWLSATRSSSVVVPCKQPAPTPPLVARPKRLAVTKIEQLMRDPYVIYVQKILGLYKLDDIDAEISAADFGNFVHKALEKYNEIYDGELATLLKCADDILAEEYQNQNILQVFWLPRFAKIADWVLQKEHEAREQGAKVLSEVESEITIDSFGLYGIADRIEDFSGGMRVIDYKTGTPPSPKDVKLGISPQISLLALIFSHQYEKHILSCEFWKVSGSETDKVTAIEKDLEQIIEEAYEGVTSLLDRFKDPKTPFIARPRPQVALAYNDYAHLARIQEWE